MEIETIIHYDCGHSHDFAVPNEPQVGIGLLETFGKMDDMMKLLDNDYKTECPNCTEKRIMPVLEEMGYKIKEESNDL